MINSCGGNKIFFTYRTGKKMLCNEKAKMKRTFDNYEQDPSNYTKAVFGVKIL